MYELDTVEWNKGTLQRVTGWMTFSVELVGESPPGTAIRRRRIWTARKKERISLLALIAVRKWHRSVGVQRVRRCEIDAHYYYIVLKNKSLFARSTALKTVVSSRDDVCTQPPVRYPCPCNGSHRDAATGNSGGSSERRLVRVRFNSVVALAVCKK